MTAPRVFDAGRAPAAGDICARWRRRARKCWRHVAVAFPTGCCLAVASPGGVEEIFVSLGVPATGSEPPTDAVMPPMDELVRLFAGYGCEILGPPLSLSDLS